VQDVVIPEKDLLTSRFTSVPISNVLNFEGIANRDSYPYGPTYGLSKDIRTLLRGTLRYPGYCDLVQSFKDIGLLDTNILKNPISSWANLVPSVMRARGIAINDDDRASVNDAAQDVLGSARAERLFDALTWLGLDPSSSSSDLPKVSHDRLAPIDYLTSALAHGLRYQPLERDVVVLSHEVIARPASSGPKAAEEIHTSQLITYGTPSASAMSRTVGLPVAFAALQVLDGKVSVRGVQGP
jgi:alpha-aminoadipic semialdehyde synthase